MMSQNRHKGHIRKKEQIIIPKLNPKWITGETEMDDEVVDWANKFGKKIYDNNRGLTTSQIRKFYGEVMRISADYDKYKGKVPFLSAKLAYAVGRNDNRGLREFYDNVSIGVQSVNGKEDFNRFVQVLEAIVAFHKYHGGK